MFCFCILSCIQLPVTNCTVVNSQKSSHDLNWVATRAEYVYRWSEQVAMTKIKGERTQFVLYCHDHTLCRQSGWRHSRSSTLSARLFKKFMYHTLFSYRIFISRFIHKFTNYICHLITLILALIAELTESFFYTLTNIHCFSTFVPPWGCASVANTL